MKMCIGQRLDAPGWTGLPLGRFLPQGHEATLAVAATQDTLFVWKNGASPVRVRTRGSTFRYARHAGVIDLMATGEEAWIAHERPEAPGEALLVAVPQDVRKALVGSATRHHRLSSRFAFSDPLVYEAAHALERQCIEGEPLGKLFTESMSTALVGHLIGNYGEPTLQHSMPLHSRNGALSAAQRDRLLHYIEERLGSNVGLHEMALHVGCSATHFLRLFGRTFGTSPHQFVVQLRVERAKHLLRGERHSLADVASACGFASQSHFTASFARRTGVTPGRWRSERRS